MEIKGGICFLRKSPQNENKRSRDKSDITMCTYFGVCSQHRLVAAFSDGY